MTAAAAPARRVVMETILIRDVIAVGWRMQFRLRETTGSYTFCTLALAMRICPSPHIDATAEPPEIDRVEIAFRLF